MMKCTSGRQTKVGGTMKARTGATLNERRHSIKKDCIRDFKGGNAEEITSYCCNQSDKPQNSAL